MAKRSGHTALKSAGRGPEFVRLFAPLIDTLRDLGDSGRPKEVSDRIALRMNLSEDELNQTNKNGQSRFENQVAWARFHLAKAGLIDTSRRGVWTLTEVGRRTNLDHQQALQVFREVQGSFKDGERRVVAADAPDEGPPPDKQGPVEDSFRVEMATKLKSLSAEGFERLCQRLLREVGFEEVIVTGRSGDGGIDGYGKLKINRLVSERVLFQCKKHAKQISPSYIREFRGSMAARADRGIFLATSTFSTEAKREAAREGAVPIEMVDLDDLISLLIDLGLGVMEQKAYSVDEEFFQEYMPEPTLAKSR